MRASKVIDLQLLFRYLKKIERENTNAQDLAVLQTLRLLKKIMEYMCRYFSSD